MDRREFEAMLALDERHWWYRGRRRMLAALLDGIELPAAASVLDAGCGSGRTLDELYQKAVKDGLLVEEGTGGHGRGGARNESSLPNGDTPEARRQ